MIARTWRGATRARDADDYVDYLRRTGFAEYGSAAGNLGVLGFRRLRGERAEFLLVSLWESPEAVVGFAGPDEARAVFYPEDERYLVGRNDRAEHYEVVYQEWRPQGRTERPGLFRRVLERGRGLWASAVPRSEARLRGTAPDGWRIVGLR